MSDYTRNHYVPQWLQHRFLPKDGKEKKFFYLDLRPDVVVSKNVKHTRRAVLRWGPRLCFCQDNLYTTRFGSWQSTEIEEKFFGKVDSAAPEAIEYFDNFLHPSVSEDAFYGLLPFMSIQKLRTPKGLAFLAELVQVPDKNILLFRMQELQNLFCALWTECVWSIVDASDSNTKFILSDHPVTVYNKGCLPGSKWCLGHRDPDIAFSGTHTIFPLSLNKALILTNLSWVRNPYSFSRKLRPNPNPFRGALFNFTSIQTGRKLSDHEVNQINYVIKKRAYRYIAAAKEEWLYPERKIPSTDWNTFGDQYLFMPDPRGVRFSSEVIIGYKNNRADFFDAYGRKPWQPDYKSEAEKKIDWDSSLAFQGEFARIFGPKRRGQSSEMNRLDNEEDSPEYHAYHLTLEDKYKSKMNG